MCIVYNWKAPWGTHRNAPVWPEPMAGVWPNMGTDVRRNVICWLIAYLFPNSTDS